MLQIVFEASTCSGYSSLLIILKSRFPGVRFGHNEGTNFLRRNIYREINL